MHTRDTKTGKGLLDSIIFQKEKVLFDQKLLQEINTFTKHLDLLK